MLLITSLYSCCRKLGVSAFGNERIPTSDYPTRCLQHQLRRYASNWLFANKYQLQITPSLAANVFASCRGALYYVNILFTFGRCRSPCLEDLVQMPCAPDKSATRACGLVPGYEKWQTLLVRMTCRDLQTTHKDMKIMHVLGFHGVCVCVSMCI